MASSWADPPVVSRASTTYVTPRRGVASAARVPCTAGPAEAMAGTGRAPTDNARATCGSPPAATRGIRGEIACSRVLCRLRWAATAVRATGGGARDRSCVRRKIIATGPGEQLDQPLPAAVRQRVVETAADVVGSLRTGEVPPPLRRVARFEPRRRAKLAAAPIAAQLEGGDEFRGRVAGA